MIHSANSPGEALKADPPPDAAQETVEQQFHRLAAAWLANTAHMSSSSAMVADPAFQQIVALGAPVVPLLLRELRHRSGHWHRALKKITAADPVPPNERGNLARITEHWLRWGEEHGYA
jgi:hypothetical protein